MKPRFLENQSPRLIELLDRLSKNLHDPRLKIKVSDGFYRRLGHWDRLLETFSCTSLNSKYENELLQSDWNPLNQQLLLFSSQPLEAKLESDFFEVAEGVESCNLALHEALHAALWEPFFVGKLKVKNHKQYQKLVFSFEGACFWFTDCISSAAIRDALPDNEIVRNRSSFTGLFLPYRALRAVGAISHKQTFRIFTLAFRGEKTSIMSQSDRFARQMAKRIYGFYYNSLATTKAMHDSLKEIGVFDEFYARFCLEGLPSLLSERALSSFVKMKLDQYSWQMIFSHIKRLDRISEDELLAIRVRRAIQTRAYFAFSLLRVIKHGLVVSYQSKWTGFDQRNILNWVNNYLNALEFAVIALLGHDVMSATIIIEDADKDFEKVRKLFQKKDVWVSRRKMIYPKLGGQKSFDFGIINQKSNRHKINIDRNYCLAIAEMLSFKGKQILIKDPTSLRLAVEIVERLKKLDDSSIAKDSYLLRRLNKAMSRPEILERWSVQLASINPQKNVFFEPSFKFI